MPILHNCAHKVLQQIIELQNDLDELHLNVEESIRHSDRRAVFGAETPVKFDFKCIKDQVPAFWRCNKIIRGTVAAVDYRMEKVTVNSGSVAHEGTEKKLFLNLCLILRMFGFQKIMSPKETTSPILTVVTIWMLKNSIVFH